MLQRVGHMCDRVGREAVTENELEGVSCVFFIPLLLTL